MPGGRRRQDTSDQTATHRFNDVPRPVLPETSLFPCEFLFRPRPVGLWHPVTDRHDDRNAGAGHAGRWWRQRFCPPYKRERRVIEQRRTRAAYDARVVNVPATIDRKGKLRHAVFAARLSRGGVALVALKSRDQLRCPVWQGAPVRLTGPGRRRDSAGGPLRGRSRCAGKACLTLPFGLLFLFARLLRARAIDLVTRPWWRHCRRRQRWFGLDQLVWLWPDGFRRARRLWIWPVQWPFRRPAWFRRNGRGSGWLVRGGTRVHLWLCRPRRQIRLRRYGRRRFHRKVDEDYRPARHRFTVRLPVGQQDHRASGVNTDRQHQAGGPAQGNRAALSCAHGCTLSASSPTSPTCR